MRRDQETFETQRWAVQDQPLEFWHREALERIQKGPVLDLGCGDGLLLFLLKERGIHGVGLDISETGIAKGREKGLDMRQFDLLGGGRLPFADHSFPAVTILEVLEHLYAPEALLKEARRVLAPSGVLFVSSPNFNSLPARIQMLTGRVPENNTPGKGHIYWMNRTVVRRLLEGSGFRIKEESHWGIWQGKEFRFLIGKTLADFLPDLFALSFFMSAELR